eukprot:gene14071-20017_t
MNSMLLARRAHVAFASGHPGSGKTLKPSARSASRAVAPKRSVTVRAAGEKEKKQDENPKGLEALGLGDLLGPIGLTVGDVEKKKKKKKEKEKKKKEKTSSKTSSKKKKKKTSSTIMNIHLSISSPTKKKKNSSFASNGADLGDLLGPIGLTVGESMQTRESADASSSGKKLESIHSMTTEEWRAKYEKDGTVDVWLEDEFNAGSRLIGGRDVHKGGTYGIATGEGPSRGDVPVHKVVIQDRYGNQVVEVQVPEDRYILWEAEDEGLELPYACRMGCCTACAVKIKEGEMYQPEALGISLELREQGYGLMCVGYPLTDLVLESVDDDEVYDLQFGSTFAAAALDPNSPEFVERDDFALEIANMDE